MKPDIFAYIAPTFITTPRHAAIRAAEAACAAEIVRVAMPIVGFHARCAGVHAKATPADFAAISAACREYLAVCTANAPQSADLAAAERCIRLARMLANEALIQPDRAEAQVPERLVERAREQLQLARMQASAAVALADDGELPPIEVA